MPKTIKIRYLLSVFNIEKLKKVKRLSVEINLDGQITISHYGNDSRKATTTEKHEIKRSDFHLLCYKLRECISTADRLTEYIDDAEGTVYIYDEFGKTEVMDRGYGNERQTVGAIMNAFLADKIENFKI